MRRFPTWATALVVAIGLVAVTLLGTATPASAANAGVVPPLVEQCNDSGAIAGMELRCTITVVNYLNANGTLASSPASTVTVQTCVGPAGAAICGPSTVSNQLVPVTTARQCNAAYFGGGSTIVCTATITNHWAASAGPTPATIYQCVGSPITGPGAPGVCSPPEIANTALSTPLATVGQCNGSGYGGGTPVGGFICTVNASTTTALLPIHVDQCNGSGYGGGGTVICTSTVTNDVIAVPPPAAQVPNPGAPLPAGEIGYPVDIVVPIVAPVAPPVVVVPIAPGVVPAAPPTAVVLAPVVVPPGVTEVVLPPVVVPPEVAEVIVPVVVPPGAVPRVVVRVVPLPAPTGNGGLAAAQGSDVSPWMAALVAVATAGFALTGRALVRSRSRQ